MWGTCCMYSIILAGGSGSRLWPLSREMCPKQLINIQNKNSLLQETFKRIADIVSSDKIVSITNTKHYSNVKYQLSSLSSDTKVLSEPIAKNTAPAVAISVKYIMSKTNEDEIILVAPSDHIIEDAKAFRQALAKGEELANQGYIVTFGVTPDYPETGYGYIKLENGKVQKFVEKPEKSKAKDFIKEGGWYWNSGIFMFKASTIMNAFKTYADDIYNKVNEFDFSKTDEIPFIEFDKLPNISIDYAIMEKADNLVLVELQSDWKDIGSWQSLYDTNDKDENGNVKVGHILDIDSKNSFMYSSSKLVASIGLEDTVVVETEDAILACKRDRVQDVKQVFETLKQQHDDTHLVHKTMYRPWGFYTVLAQGNGFLTKMIQVNPGQKLSIQSHNHRSEHWVVLSGLAKVVLEGKDIILSPGHSVDIPVKAIHSLQNPYEEELKIIEVQKGDLLIEEDIIRYEDMYGRV